MERIIKGQLVNIRTMQNAMWTTAPGRVVRNVTFRDLTLDADNSATVNSSMILGYDAEHPVENVTFENIKVGDRVIYDGMDKPRWYMVTDLVPVFANEHVRNLRFKQIS